MTMRVGGGVEILRTQYLAGFKEDRVASYPTVPRLDVQVAHKIDGTIDDVFKAHPELEACLYNDVKVCTGCGKPCAYTMTVCNSCGKQLPTACSKSENVFSAFLFGVKLANKGFPYTISLRRETEEVLVFDDMLALCPCHLNGVPKQFYIPDWRFLLLCPERSLALLKTLEAELWNAAKPFLENAEYRKTIYRQGVTDEDIKNNIMISFNFPPSQFQLHVQYLVPPLTPMQHNMAENKNHFHKGRAFPLSYVKKILDLNIPYEVNKDTAIEAIVEHYKGHGIDYDVLWEEWFEKVCLGSTLAMQNWQVDDFKYVVQDGKVHNFSVKDGKIELGDVVTDGDSADPSKIQGKDKAILQNYGRPYNEAGKPGGTYIQNPLEPKMGDGGFNAWPPA